MTAGSAQPTKSRWFGPAGGLPEVLLFFALVWTHATYTTNEAAREAGVVSVSCAAIAALLLVLSWRRSSIWERSYSVALGAASVWVFVVAGHTFSWWRW